MYTFDSDLYSKDTNFTFDKWLVITNNWHYFSNVWESKSHEKIMDLAGCSRIPSHITTTKEVFGDTNTFNRLDKSAETENKSTSSDQHENLVFVEGGTNENCEHNFVAPRSNNECQVLVECLYALPKIL
ncbi:hypothetical protein FQA39_LY15130 [Lamprigera yunnana]|nr:hypothetical protein FQA39_LY15130 [Lamprigera yunnana]